MTYQEYVKGATESGLIPAGIKTWERWQELENDPAEKAAREYHRANPSATHCHKCGLELDWSWCSSCKTYR